MTIAGVQPQIWISVIAILGIAGLALLVDYLRGKNQQLREAMVELRLRRAQELRQGPLNRMTAAAQLTEKQAPPPADPKGEQKKFVAAAAQAAAARIAAEKAAAPADAPAAVEPSEPAKSFEEFLTSADRNNEARERNLAIRKAQDRGSEFASTHGRRRTPPPENLPRLEDMNPREALAEWLNKRAAVRATQKPASPAAPAAPAMVPEPVAAVPATVPAPVVEAPAVEPVPIEVLEVAATPVVEPAPIAAVETAPVEVKQVPVAPIVKTATAPAAKGTAVVIDESLFDSLFAASSPNKNVRIPDWTTMPAIAFAATPAPTQIRFEVIQGKGGIPAGMHDQSTLNRLLDANKPFTGLVFSISVNQTDGSAVSRDTVLSVNHFIRTLLREEDFACQTGDDEFLMLCPEEKGSEAQSRLSELTERLWDFQLRGIGSFSVMFGWGDVQVEGESLGEAVASANERMHQTRRARKSVSLDSASPRKKVAAAF